MRTCLIVLSLVFAAGCSHVEMYPKERQASLKYAEGDPDEIICEDYRPTGSKIKSERCQTRAEWKADEEARQKAERELNSGVDRMSRERIPTNIGDVGL